MNMQSSLVAAAAVGLALGVGLTNEGGGILSVAPRARARVYVYACLVSLVSAQRLPPPAPSCAVNYNNSEY